MAHSSYTSGTLGVRFVDAAVRVLALLFYPFYNPTRQVFSRNPLENEMRKAGITLLIVVIVLGAGIANDFSGIAGQQQMVLALALRGDAGDKEARRQAEHEENRLDTEERFDVILALVAGFSLVGAVAMISGGKKKISN
jgi:hypothetical protein